MSTLPEQGCRRAGKRRLLRLMLIGALACGSAIGCSSFGRFTPTAPPPPVETLVLRGDAVVAEKPLDPKSPEGLLAGAHELFRRGDYATAGELYHSLRSPKKCPEAVVMEACFYEAECLRLQARYPKAADTYSALLKTWPSTPYRDQAVQHLYDIANYWLEDTRDHWKHKREGKKYEFDLAFVNFEKTKPFIDREGRAMEKLELVHYNDINGSLGLGDKALFWAGSVRYLNENYKEADHYYTQLVQSYPNSDLAPQAAKYAIIAKTMSTGGADYDSRKVAEAREMIFSSLRAYPTLAAEKAEFIDQRLAGITVQEAEKDYKIAEFYRRTGKPGPAWFYYTLVERRYPNTKFAQDATRHKAELKEKLERQGKLIPEKEAPATPVRKLEDDSPKPRPAQIPTPPAAAPGPLPATLEPGKK